MPRAPSPSDAPHPTGVRVLTIDGLAVHSTRILHNTATADATKVIADLLALAVSDVLLAIGPSSFSGLAGALHGGITRVGEQAGQLELTTEEIDQLRHSFGA